MIDPASHGGDPADAFTVIAPSIPGYGFSSRPKERGTSVFAVADIWAKLMTRLNLSMQLVERHGEDERLLHLVIAYQRITSWHEMHPPDLIWEERG
jgi:hypothetical protein